MLNRVFDIEGERKRMLEGFELREMSLVLEVVFELREMSFLERFEVREMSFLERFQECVCCVQKREEGGVFILKVS